MVTTLPLAGWLVLTKTVCGSPMLRLLADGIGTPTDETITDVTVWLAGIGWARFSTTGMAGSTVKATVNVLPDPSDAVACQSPSDGADDCAAMTRPMVPVS